MEEKRRPRRSGKPEDDMWECSVCTFRNTREAFKCEMCDVRKGTSTRKPKVNPDLIAQQQQIPSPPVRDTATPEPGVSKSPPKPPPPKLPLPPKLPTKRPSQQGPSTPTESASHSPPAKQPRLSLPAVLKFQHFDKKTVEKHSVTVDGVTINFTEYKLRKDLKRHSEPAKRQSEDSRLKSVRTSSSKTLSNGSTDD